MNEFMYGFSKKRDEDDFEKVVEKVTGAFTEIDVKRRGAWCERLVRSKENGGWA